MSEPATWTSPARLKTFLDCPKRYHFQHVLELPTLPSPHLDLGNNVHAALRDWMLLAPPARTWDALLELYREAWRKQRPAFERRSRAELRDWGLRGMAMLRRFVAATPPDLEPLATEKWVGAEFGGLSVRGRVDRVDRLPDGTLAVVDYKTGKFPRDVARFRAAELSPPVYARGAAEAFAGIPVSRVELVYLATMERVTFEVDDAWLAHGEALLASRVGRLQEAERAGEFAARPSGLCRTCDFRTRCPEGKAYLDALPGAR